MTSDREHVHLTDLFRHVQSEKFPVDVHSPGKARRLVRRFCEAIGQPSDTAELLISELVTNAITHAKSPCQVTCVAPWDSPAWFEVKDESPQLPALREVDLGAAGGRGLLLMDALAEHWHVEEDSLHRKKIVCFSPKGEGHDTRSAQQAGVTVAAAAP
ncbi:ATP-binding protein [Streptomyces vinaceus]|uniref:ATP-binding protein n=1 Tax=Streptomyces vinaceus TaxID=1960 RepID=UPI0036B8C419